MKKRAAEELDRSLSAVMKRFLEDVVKVHASDEEKTVVPGPKARKRCEKISDEIDAGIGLSPRFTAVKDAVAYLDAYKHKKKKR